MKQNLTGQTIDNYKIGDLLGVGGMGQVYRATHVLLNRRAAIKVMHPHLAMDPGFRARFLQEAKASADLNHPNIVHIYDFGEHQEQFYLVMELVEGGSLRTFQREYSSVPSSEFMRLALELVRQAADGLSFAHSREMVHRDIKPDNLLLSTGSAQGIGEAVLKISDFGLARLAESAVRTMSGVVMGTPAYMSPEQAQGTNVDGRSDIYSLGVVLYELTTGYLPFAAKSLSDAAYKHVHMAPPPPRQVHSEFPEAVEIAILRCLAKDPDVRYQSAADLGSAIQAVLDGIDPQTVVPPPVSTQVQHREATTRRNISDETVLNASSDRPPTSVPALSGFSQAPRLQLLRQDGAQLQVAQVTGSGLTIGRSETNDILLDEESVSRHHVRVDWDGGRVFVTDLGSRNGTILGGRRLLPQVAQDWDRNDWLQIGTVWIRLDLPAQGSAQETAARLPSVDSPVSSFRGDSDRIQVIIDQADLSVSPGQPAMVRGTLANVGMTVDHLLTTIEGIPSEWVRVPNQEVQLNPGAQAPLILQFDIPRSPESYAGQYPVTIRAQSRENPGESGACQLLIRVLPFGDSQLTVSPSRAGGRTRADYKVGVLNAGNETARFTFRGHDDEESLAYRFRENQVELGAGESATIPLTVGAPRRWIGSSENRSFQIRSNPSSGKPQTINAQLQHKAIVPTWAVPFIGAAIVGLLFLVNMLLTPTIQAFELDRSDAQYAAGEDVTLSWIVGRARTIDLENLPEGLMIQGDERLPGRSDLTFTPTWTGEHTITLIAKSWLKTREEAVRVSVLPPDPDAPIIELFAVEPPSITEGQTVMISWNVQGADSVSLDLPDGTIRTDLPPQGQLPDVPASSGAYILKASSGDISAPPQLLQIQVAAAMAAADDGADSDDAADAGGADDGDAGDEGPELPEVPPTVSIEPADSFDLVEGACVELVWDFQHVQSVERDGDIVNQSGEQVVCPDSTTTYQWQLTGTDGNDYDEARTVNVDLPMEIDDQVSLTHFGGEWKNSDHGMDFGITRIEITEEANDEVSIKTWVRCASTLDCMPPPNMQQVFPAGVFGIDLGTDTIKPDHLPKLHASYTRDSEDFYLSLGRKDDKLVARLYYFELGLLHEFTLEPAPPPEPEGVISNPDRFAIDPLWEAP